MYEVTVSGEYYQSKSGSKIRMPYVENFELPSMELALNKIQKHLINDRLKQKDLYANKFRTCAIENFKLLKDGKKKELKKIDNIDVDKMSKVEIKEYCVKNDIAIDFKQYTKLQDIRQAVKDEIENIKIAQESIDEKKKEIERNAVMSKEINELKKINKLGAAVDIGELNG